MAIFLVACVVLFQPLKAETVNIAAYGDSLVHGFGLNPEDGFVPQLNLWLKDNGVDAKILNAGVSGDTTAGGLARIDWTLADDLDAFIVVLGGNDLLRGLSPQQSESNLDGILGRITEAGFPVLLIGQEAPENFGAEYKSSFDSIYPRLAEKYDTLFIEKFFAPLETEVSREEARKRYIQEDGLHPNKIGVSIIVSAIGPYVFDLIQLVRKQDLVD